jgi:hypothetical protein
MGVTATNTALERIKEVDSFRHDILSSLWKKSFSGEISQGFVDKQLSAADLNNTGDKDVDFVISTIKLNISSQ